MTVLSCVLSDDGHTLPLNLLRIRNLFQVGFVKQGLAPEAISVLHYRWPICSFVMKVVILAN